ncbi:MAG: hypothetical protein NTU88_07500 [Armatimonadetes bacterium]|nr:hypothetical protein [Armatimonadota bacterium]
MTKPDTNLRIVNVIDPIMCLRCASAHIAEVLFTDGTTRKMFYCSRLDCDNWCGTKSVPVDEATYRSEEAA